MGARWYDSLLGRWTQPDTLIPDQYNPADWDRFQFVRSNPLKYSDPSGHKPCFLECEGEIINRREAEYGGSWHGEWDPAKQAENAAKAEAALDGFLLVGSVFIEPLDWLVTAEECINGECSPWVLLGFLPIITGSISGKLDQLLPYQVGFADELYSLSKQGDNIDIHHAPQAHPASQVISDYNKIKGPAIALPSSEHMKLNAMNIKGQYSGIPRDLLAKTVIDLKNFTNTPNSSLQQLIALVKATYPGVFTK
jgi:hypothetical protein